MHTHAHAPAWHLADDARSLADQGDAVPSLADRSDDLVLWIARFGVATAEDLSIRFGLSQAEVLRRLEEAQRARLVRIGGALAAEPALWVATRAGLRAVDLGHLRVCSVSARAEGHLRAVASTGVWLHRQLGSDHDVFHERELAPYSRTRVSPQWGRRVSPYVNHDGGSYKRPDLLVVPHVAAGGLPVAVEVELTRKSPALLEAICSAWKHCTEVGAVLYLVAPQVAAPLAAAIQRTGAEDRIAVVALAEADVPQLRRRAYYRPQPIAIPATPPASASSDRLQGRALVDWVGRWGIVTLDAAAIHLGVGDDRALYLLGRANQDGLLRGAVILRDAPVLCWATRRGLTAADLAHLPVCAVNYHAAASMAQRARVAVGLEREYPDRLIVGAREFSARPPFGDPAGATAGPGAADGSLVPRAPHAALARHRLPAIVALGDRLDRSQPIAVLVEHAPMGRESVAALVTAWASVSGLDGVILYARQPAVIRAASVAIAGVQARSPVIVRTLPAISELAP